MEVDFPNGGGGDTCSSNPSPAEIKKARLSAGGDSKMCNGDSEPMNGQNGNHKDEEAMDVDEENSRNSNGASSNGKEEEEERGSASPTRTTADSVDDGDSRESSGSLNAKMNDNGEKKDEGEDESDSVGGGDSKDKASEKSNSDSDRNGSAEGEKTVGAKDGETGSVDEGSKPATPCTIASEDSKPASPSDKSKDPSTDREIVEEIVEEKPVEMTEEEKTRAKDVALREVKLKRIEDSAKDKDDLRPVAKLLFGIGVDMAAQHIYKDLVRAQSKKDSQKKLDRRGQDQLKKLKNTYKTLNERNQSYILKLKVCEKCGFKTESDNVIEWHLEFAHGQDAGRYECSFCDFETRLPAPFFFHMEAEHSRKGRVFMRKALFSCPQCPYENNSKHAVTKHRLKCDKQFSLKRNQEPLPTDCDIPLKKPKSLVVKQTRGIGGKPQPTQIKNYLDPKNLNANIQARPTISSASTIRVSPNATVQSILSSQSRGGQLMNQQIMTQRARLLTPNRQQTQLAGPGGQMFTLVNPPVMLPQNFQSILTGVRQQSPQQQQQGIHYIPPAQNISQIAQQVVAQVTQHRSAAQQQKAIQEILKRAQPSGSPQQVGSLPNARSNAMTDAQAQAAAANNPKFEICEICGGFVKDRESLRIHFYWAHKVDIQKDVFARLNPHLKCDSCPQAFWTYQGLARHRQISHVKPRERTYRCYLCGAKNIENIITHLSMAHNVKLNTMYKTGKCLVCGLGFAGEKGLKRHIHTAHAELLKGQPDIVDIMPNPAVLKPAAMPPTVGPAKDSKGNPVPTGLFENASKKKKFEPVCSLCNIVFPNVESFTFHCNKLHVFQCWRCPEKWASKDLLNKHWFEKHRKDQDACILCGELVTIGRPLIRHMKRSHLKECSVVVTRMSPEKVAHYLAQSEVRSAGIVPEVGPKNDQPRPKDKDVIVLSDEEEEEQKQQRTSVVPEEEPVVQEEKSVENGEKKESIPEAGSSIQEVMEVDGEKIVVEISQDEDDKDSESEKKEGSNEADESTGES